MTAEDGAPVGYGTGDPQAGSRWVDILRAIGWTLVWGMVTGGAILIGAAVWIRRTFGAISFDQMLLHLPGAGGAETTAAETGYISSFVWQALVIPVGAVALLFVCWTILRSVARRRSRDGRSDAATGVSLASRLRQCVPGLLATLALLVGAGFLAQSIGLPQYLRSMNSSWSMSEFYVAPQVELRGQDAPRNLVLIYLESIEDGLGDADLFGLNMLEPLQAATEDWLRVDHFSMFDGGGWTMAGIVGTQCGIPLRGVQSVELGTHNLIGEGEDSFLPGAVCLGDVLADAGYTNVFMGGADARFASKENFLRQHGYQSVEDLRTWEGQGLEELSTWGLSDRELFQQAKSEVMRLHDEAAPFNLTLLTLDNHPPAHVFDYCDVTTEVVMTSVTRCSMQQVADFVSFLEEEGLLEDTAVVLMGDHETFISADSDYQDLLHLEERTVFLRMYSPDEIGAPREHADQLSMFASILELVGFDLDAHRAGIGVSVFAGPQTKGTILALPPEVYSEVLQSRSSDLYRDLWDLTEDGEVASGFFDPKTAVSQRS